VSDPQPPKDEKAEPDEDDWAAEIKRLRAARGERLAERLRQDDGKEPPVDDE
jgi:hypothetical protein